MVAINRPAEPFMTSPIGDLPLNSDGLRRAVDEIARLKKENENLIAENTALKANAAEAT